MRLINLFPERIATILVIFIILVFTECSPSDKWKSHNALNGVWRYENEPSRIEIDHSFFKAVYERMGIAIKCRINWTSEHIAMLTITDVDGDIPRDMKGEKIRMELIEATDDYLQLRIEGQCIYVVKVLNYKTYDKRPCRDTLPYITWKDTIPRRL